MNAVLGPRTALAVILSLVSLAAIGCASAKKPVGPLVTETAPSPRFVTTEYEYVTVTGSQIPVRVPKGTPVTALPSISPVGVMSGEEFRSMLHRGQVGR